MTGDEWEMKKKILIVLGLELLVLITMGFILIPGGDEKQEGHTPSSLYTDFKILEAAFTLGVVFKFFAWLGNTILHRIGFNVLATLCFSYWIVGSYVSSVYLFMIVLFLLVIPLVPAEKLLKGDD